jgi:4a-hydroxytetrahydrobiopterin dehydratase
MRAGDSTTKLTADSVRGWLSDRSGWKRQSNKLTKEFRFSHFRDSIVFVNRVATLADTYKHHPDIDVRNGRVTLALSTSVAGGITTRDLNLAEQIDFATSLGRD